jgi:hypothetical protein
MCPSVGAVHEIAKLWWSMVWSWFDLMDVEKLQPDVQTGSG